MAAEKKVLLSLKNVDVKFNVRGRILSAIRNVSLDIYENESIAIVGESGSGKSVLTKTFAGMLDSNGFISNGSIIFSDDELSKTNVDLTDKNKKLLERLYNTLNKFSVFERGAAELNEIESLKLERKRAQALTEDEENDYAVRLKTLSDGIVDKENFILTLDKKNAEDAALMEKLEADKRELEAQKAALLQEKEELVRTRKESFKADPTLGTNIDNKIKELTALRTQKLATADDPSNPEGLTKEVLDRNRILSYEYLLSIGRYPKPKQMRYIRKINAGFKAAMEHGVDLNDKNNVRDIFDDVTFLVEFRNLNEEENRLEGYAITDCAKVKNPEDWQQIRGRRIATVFQDPMTSLNPVITIGEQIMTVILKHQKCSKEEAKARTLDIMAKVGIPEPEKRFDDYPFQYSGGMRQRIVIAIALSCQPKILICDEPTTALDVTIQAQIIRLIKDLQKELGFTTVYITHDLGVVANVAERVAVLYGGQIVEIGTVEDIFYDPRHPYTWALLSSMPQLAERGTEMFSIPGTPPSLYNKIVGDAFAPRNKYCMAIDLVKEPPMFQVSETHFAKTWLLDPRAPKVEKPANIQNLHEKMKATIVDFEI